MNIDIRRELLERDMKQWKLAEKIGISESKLSKMLRRKLTEEERQSILKAIEELSN